MKKLLSILALVSLIVTACEPTGNEVKNSAIKLTTDDQVNVGSGSAMGFLKYDLVTPIEGVKVEATADVEWINNFGYKEMGKITYTVERNPDEGPRTGVITVTYDSSSFQVTINQAGNPAPTNKTISDFKFTGKYYGIQAGMYNYYLIFNDLGLDSSNSYYVPNAHYYFVDLYLLETPADMNHITIPVGTYEFDKTNSGFANTFTDTYSWYQINDESGNASSKNQISYETGKLIVEEGKVTLEVTLYIDDILEKHTVIYEGDYSFINEA